MIKRSNKIVIVSGGVIETDGLNYYGRSQLVEYLTEFHKYYEKVTWSVRLAKSHDYHTCFDSSKVTLDIINKKGGGFFSIHGVWEQIKHYCFFSRKLDISTDVIVNNLSLLSFPYVFIARFFGHTVVFYLGSDPKLTMKLRNDSFYGKIASLLNYLVFPLTLMSAHGVLVRGKTTLGQSLRWNKNTILSNPLISYKHFNKSIDRQEKKDDASWSLLFVGKLEENKGVHVLIKALAIILEKCRLDKPVGLHIVGSGPMEGELRLLVAKYGIADRVHFYGFVDNADKLKSLFAMSDVFVVPTLYSEGFPRVIDEAMASGLPVICSEIGGMKDGLEKDEVFFVEPGDADGLAIAIVKIAENERLRKDFQESSNRRVRKILQSTATEQHAQFLARLRNRKK